MPARLTVTWLSVGTCGSRTRSRTASKVGVWLFSRRMLIAVSTSLSEVVEALCRTRT